MRNEVFMRNAILLALAVSACGGTFGDDACVDDPLANRAAINPATGECWEFDSSCDVPAGWMPCGMPIECDAEHACPPDRICMDGRCVAVETGCATDDDCACTQRCDHSGMGAPTPPDRLEFVPGVCVDNAICAGDGDCAAGQWCDLECGPSDPGCDGGGIALSGLCSRCPRPEGSCSVTGDCPVGEICLAEWGGPNRCEPTCLDSSVCAADEYCNAGEVCVTPSPGAPPDAPVPPACYGWCAQILGMCDVTADCASGEICPAEYTGELSSTCEKACMSTSECPTGEHCSVDDGYCGAAQPKRTPPGGNGGKARSNADAALLPICQGWCW